MIRSPILAATMMAVLAAGAWLPRTVHAQVEDSSIVSLMEEHSVLGLALAVVTPDSTSLFGFGSTRLEGGEPITGDTPFRLASVAKVLVAATVLTEARAGRLDVRSDISALVDVPLEGHYAGPVTLHDLMTHTAGFDERFIGYGARNSAEMRPLGEYLADRMPARGWPTGALVGYSNHGMSLAAYVVESGAGESFADVAASKLFGPLDMTSTMFLTRGGEIPVGAAEPSVCEDGECTALPHLFSNPYPAGLAFSTARDMSSFIAAVISGEDGPPGLEDLVPARFTHDPRIPGMSYGFFNQIHAGRRALAHSGLVPGYSALLLIFPEERVGFFFATNGGDASFGAELRDYLLDLTLGAAPAPSFISRRTEDPARRTGTYELTRYSHDTIERFPQVFLNSISVDARGDSLVILGERYLQVDDSLYQSVGGEKLLAFGTREGRSYLFRPSEVYGARLPAAYERRRSSPYFLNEYVSWLFAIPVLAVFLGWPLLVGLGVFLRRRRRGDPRGFHALSLLATLCTAAAAILFGWFGMGFIARSNQLFDSGEIVFGMPDSLASMIWIPPAHLALTALLVLALPMAWKNSWWGLPRRIAYSALVLVFLLQVSFLVSWNYLPAVW